MPCPAMHCRLCAKQGKTWTARGSNFAERMASLRRHRKDEHPSAKKAKRLDPIKLRKRLTSKPAVTSYADFRGRDSLIRILVRIDKTRFPELALYGVFRPKFDANVLKDAGFRQEEPRKWVLRTNKLNIFVYT